jgi:4,5-dihydroxyphthalate decarboxylase
MTTTQLDVYGMDYEHTQDVSGTYRGVAINYKTAPGSEIFHGMLREQRYEACEFSLSNFLMLKDRGASWLRAIPVFPYRAFRHSILQVRKDSPLTKPADLAGRKIGVPDYSMTAAVWGRGLMLEQYGLSWSDVHWLSSNVPRFPPAEGVHLTMTDADLEKEVIQGRIDAILSPDTRDQFLPLESRKLRPLISNTQQAEEAYFRASGVYPINHVVVVREDVYAKDQNIPLALFDAFEHAKAACYKRRLGTTLVPWSTQHWTKTLDLFDGDPIPYGLTPTNRHVIELLQSFLLQQRLVQRNVPLDDIFF